MAKSQPDSREPGTIESSLALLERARAGDSEALEALLTRYLPRMRRWARGRLPRAMRDLADTDDLVQEVLVRTLGNLDRFSAAGDASFEVYLRQALWNRIRDEIRAASRREPRSEITPDMIDGQPSPVERAIGRDALERYEAALDRLPADEREAIVGRFELGYDYRELARALGKFTPDAARKMVQRGLLRLSDLMRRAT